MADIPQAVIDTLIAEAAGEGPEGMRRVAETILNRAAIRGLTPEQVVTQRAQYTGYSNPGPAARRAQSNADMRAAAEAAFHLAMQPGDPTGGADHYYAPGTINQPGWASSMTPTGEYGGHAFFSSRPVPPGEIPNVVASLTDTVPPRPPVPVAMSPDLSLLRNPRVSAEARAAQVTPQRLPQPRAADIGLTRQNPVTPRLTDAGDNIYSYHIPEMTPTSLAGGMGSLTPDIGATPFPTQQSPQMAALRSRDQGLQSILDQRYPREATQYPPMRLPELPPSNLGQPPVTRTVPSIPMNMPPTQAEIDRAPGQVIATYPTTAPPTNRLSRDAIGQGQLGQRVATQVGPAFNLASPIPQRLITPQIVQPQTVALNQPPLQIIPGMPTMPRMAAPVPMPAGMRPVAPFVRQAAAPQQLPRRSQGAGSPLRIVVQASQPAAMPAPIQMSAAQRYNMLTAASRGAPSLEDRITGNAYSSGGGAQSLSS